MAVEPIAWRCFHCDEVFHDRRCAAAHFGADEDATPACQIKMGGERTLLDALRQAERDAGDATLRMLNESTEAAKAYYAQQGRHAEQITAAEQLGYERGLRDAGLHHDHLKAAATALERVAQIEKGWNKPHRVSTARQMVEDCVSMATHALAALSNPPNIGDRP